MVLAIGLLAIFSWPREPRYAGKSLSVWLQELPSFGTRPGVEAANAIRAMGTNALPTLLARIQAKVPLWKMKLNPILDKQHLVKFRFRTSDFERAKAVVAFEILGPVAAPAVPSLVRALGSKEPRIRVCAAGALGGIGIATPEGVSGLIKLLGDQDHNVRFQAASALGAIGPASVRSLLVALENGNPSVQLAAMNALESVFVNTWRHQSNSRNLHSGKPGFELEKVFGEPSGCDAADAVKILILLLHQEDKQVRGAACGMLGSFGVVAKDATSGLIEAMQDPDEQIRNAANSALYHIGYTNRLMVPANVNFF